MFHGTGHLTRFIFRQQRLKIFVWLLGLIVVTVAGAAAYPNMYQDEQEKQAFAITMDNPVMNVLVGPGYEEEAYIDSIGTVFANELLLFTVIAVAIMSILLVTRSTRADEEDGRTEIVYALPVGRLSYMSAAMIILFGTNGLLTLFTGTGLVALGLEGVNVEGAFLYGAILGATGLVFGGTTAVIAQLSETSRGTILLSFMALMVAYLVRAIGDASHEALSYLSPLGWAVRGDVFAGNDWWPVLLLFVLSLVMVSFAFYFHVIRDLGSGFLTAKAGRRHASAFLQTPLGLILRLQRTHMTVWAIVLFILAVSFGAILDDLEMFFEDIEFMEALLSDDPDSTLTEQFLVFLMTMMALPSSVPAMMVMLHLKGEENKYRTENYFSRAVSRTRLMGSYLFFALVMSVLMQLLIATGFWSAGTAVMDDPFSLGVTFASAFVYLPAIWIIIGLVVLCVGLVPKATGVVWFYLIYNFVIVYLGELRDFPEWVENISAFIHVPQIPIEDMEPMRLFIMTIIAVVLMVIGFVGYRKRDIER